MKKAPQKNNTFCHYPFQELTLKMWNNEGKLTQCSPCCMMMNESLQGVDVSILHKKTPQEIFQSKPWNKLRKDMLTNVRNPACKICWDLEDNGQTSFRLFSVPITNEEAKNPKLKTIDITLSNVCNLRCRMCDTTSSNQINKDFDILERQGTRNEMFQITASFAQKTKPKQQHKSKQFKWLMRNTDKITELKASGGEPFYDKHIRNLLRKYIKTGNAKNTKLHFHTNATMIDDRVLDIIKHFKMNRHTFSVDGTGNVYNYIRHQADFNVLENNIKNYLLLDNIEKLDFNMVVSAHNIHNVPDYIKWIKSFGKDFTVVFSDVYPKKRGIQISNLPKYLLEPVYEELQPIDLPEKQKSTLLEILEIAMSTPYDDYGAMKLYRETVILDQARNQSYRDFLYPQMVKYLNGVEQIYLTKNKK